MRNGQVYQIGNVERGYGVLDLFQVVTEFVFAYVMCDQTRGQQKNAHEQRS